MSKESRNRSRAARRAAMKRRLLALWANVSPADALAGRAWYDRAQSAACELWPDDPTRAAAIIAALSPRQRWAVNVAQAARVIECAQTGAPCPAVGMTGNREKAWKIANGGNPADILGGPKVCAFFANITGDHSQVTIDSWAQRAAYGDWQEWLTRADTLRKVTAPTGNEYTDIADAYRSAADIIGISARDFQAAIWIHVRGAAD